MLLSATRHILFFSMLLSFSALTGCSGGAEERATRYLEKGKELFSAGNYEKAKLEFRNVLQIDPNHVDARYQLARIVEEYDNETRAAVANYNKVIELDPTHLDAMLRVSRLYFLGGAVDKAMELVTKALELSPQNVDALTLIGGIHARKDENDEALKYADSALVVDPENVEAIMLRSALYNKNGESDQAIDLLLKGAQRYPQDVNFLKVLASIYASNDKLDKARDALEKVIKLQPDELSHRVSLAQFFLTNDKKNEAIQVIRIAEREMASKKEVRMALVQLLIAQGKLDLAESELLDYINKLPEEYEYRLVLSDIYKLQKDGVKQEAVLRELIQLAKDQPDGLLAKTSLAAKLLEDGEETDARQLVDSVLKTNPGDNRALSLRANMAIANNDPDVAISAFRALLKDQPTNIFFMRQMAQAYIMKQELPLARDTLKVAVEIAPDNVELGFYFVQTLLRMGEPEPAIEHLQKLQMMEIANNANYGLAEMFYRAYMAKSDFDRAREQVNIILSQQPDKAQGYYLAGLVAQAQQQWGESIKQFDLAIDKQGDAVQPLSALVKSLLEQKKTDKALHRLDRVLKKYPEHFVAYNLKGEVLLARKEYGEAEKSFSAAIKIKPTLTILYRNLANARLAQKNVEGAIKTYRAGIDSNPESETLYVALASLYDRMGNQTGTIEVYESLLKQNPDSIVAANNLAMMLISYRSDESSISQAKKLVEKIKFTDNPAYLDTVGWVYYKSNEYDKALPVLQQALDKSPDSPLLQYHLGMVQYQQGQKVAAKANLEKALASEKRFHGVEDARKVVEQLAGL